MRSNFNLLHFVLLSLSLIIYDIMWAREKQAGAEHMGTFIVLMLVAGAAALAIRQMIKDKKAGKSLSCGGDCSRCSGCRPDQKPAADDTEK